MTNLIRNDGPAVLNTDIWANLPLPGTFSPLYPTTTAVLSVEWWKENTLIILLGAVLSGAATLLGVVWTVLAAWGVREVLF